MGKVTMAGAGGGADLDVITAAANDVLAGRVIVGPDGEPLTGTLALTGTAADSQVLSGKTYYNTDSKTKRTGTMLTMGGQTVTPGAVQQSISCAGRYMTGNIVVQGINKYYHASLSVNPTSGMTMYFNGNASMSDYIYYYDGTVPYNVKLLIATARCPYVTEEGSIIVFNDSFNTVYRKTDPSGCRLYPDNINTYRFQSGVNFRVPLGGSNAQYIIDLVGYYYM